MPAENADINSMTELENVKILTNVEQGYTTVPTILDAKTRMGHFYVNRKRPRQQLLLGMHYLFARRTFQLFLVVLTQKLYAIFFKLFFEFFVRD